MYPMICTILVEIFIHELRAFVAMTAEDDLIWQVGMIIVHLC